MRPDVSPAEGGRVRVLFVNAHVAIGGGQALQTVHLFHSLQRSVEGTMLCLRAAGVHRELANDPNIRMVGDLAMPSGILDLARAVRRARGTYDIVQVFEAYFSLPACFLARAYPRVLRMGADPILELGDRYGAPVRWAVRMGLPVMLRDTHVVVNARPLAGTFQRYHPLVIPNGVELSRFEGLPSKSEARASLGLPAEPPLLLLVCKVIPVKRVEWFLEVVRRIPESHGIVVGGFAEPHYGTAYFDRLRAQYADTMGRVRFVGEVAWDRVREYLAAADIFVFPSRFEGMPNALLEAMAAGIPPVVSDIPAHRELIADGKNGYLAASAELLTDRTSRLVHDSALRRQVGQSAAEFVRTNFSAERTAERYLAMYRQILDGVAPTAPP
jgi:glycosyltransferase involved in cell wall biosynthesis